MQAPVKGQPAGHRMCIYVSDLHTPFPALQFCTSVRAHTRTPWRAAAFGCVFETPPERAMRKRFRDALAAKAASQEGWNNEALQTGCLLCDQHLDQQQQALPRPEPVLALHPSAAVN